MMQNDPLNIILTRVEKTGELGHKDLLLTKDVETTAGSNVLKGFMPQYSATVVLNLAKKYKTKAKLNLDAWAHGSSGENSDFGVTKNPWNPAYTAGGSSSGSAAAVAARYVAYATATDTGGSIRLPASFTGTTGLKPTYGSVSRYGVIAMASSLDCPGLITQDVSNLETVFKVIAREDPHDATTINPTRHKKTSDTVTTIGIPKEFVQKGLDPEVEQAFNTAISDLKKEGYAFKEVSLPHTKYGVAVYYVIQTTEVASNLGRYDGIRYGHDRSKFASEAKRRIMLGTFASSAGYGDKYYEKAAQVRTLIVQDFEKAFQEVDVLLAPVSPAPPFKLGEKVNSPIQMYLSDILTVTANLAGVPALALPNGFTREKLPLGMQIIGPRWGESRLFNLGKKYQNITQWHQQVPPHTYGK